MRHFFSILSLVRRLRKVYRKSLQRFLIFRLIKNVVLKVYFRYPILFLNLSRLFVTQTKTLTLISISEYAKREGFPTRNLYRSSKKNISGPKFIANIPEEGFEKNVSLLEPPITISAIVDAMVVGGTDFLLKGNYAIHQDVQVIKRDVIPAEYHGVAKVDAVKHTITLDLHREPRRFECAISLLGNCTGNYAHWLTETLPKLVLLDLHSESTNYPILVDEAIHPNIASSISLLNKFKREIIEVSKWEAVFVRHLINVSPPGYAPPESRQYYEYRIFPRPDSSLFQFSGNALNSLRQAGWNVSSGALQKTYSRKLYLCRPQKFTGNGRLIINIEKVEELISEYGFTAVNPGDMSFSEQVELFKNADFIISPIGAALVNAIFLPPHSKVLVLSPYHENANYYYFSNLMGTLGHDMHYLIGPQVEGGGSNDHILHKNYSINLDDLKSALEQLT